MFMDRHPVPPGVTLQEATKVHDLDVAIEAKYHCHCHTFWLDKERGYVTCLVEAPDKESVLQLHRAAHGNVPSSIMDVHPELVMAFLGRLGDVPEESGGGVKIDSSFRCIMFTDLKDSTAMTTRLGDVRARELLRIHDDMIRKALADNCGREVKHTGDGFMASFSEAADCVNSALAIQDAFAGYNRANPAAELHVRIGISAGEPVVEKNDLFGTAVQMAARICAEAAPGQILVHEMIRSLCKNLNTVFFDHGEKILKGFDEPIKMLAIRPHVA